MAKKKFNVDCAACSRLSKFLLQIKSEHPGYYAAPVPPFGDKNAHMLIVGLAPGMHGANATGRPFTGDDSGKMLFETLYKYGFSNKAESVSPDDGLELIDCCITNAVKCLPPQNKPVGSEVENCNGYLLQELEGLPENSVVVSLGSVAHQAIIRAFGLRQKAYPFGHGALHQLKPGLYLLDSYHCSRYNTQTRRLTVEMFENVFARARELLKDLSP